MRAYLILVWEYRMSLLCFESRDTLKDKNKHDRQSVGLIHPTNAEYCFVEILNSE